MGDLDINLITLYARTPALYDKRNPFYKDKQYSERAWNDISMKLGYKGNHYRSDDVHSLHTDDDLFSVEILKDRMLQLRNRYNLEKRKIETMRSETCQNPKSTWALFKYLLFFDGHIKQRRSYKMLKKIQDAEAADKNSDSYANSSTSDTFKNEISLTPSMLHDPNDSMSEIKNEEDSDLDMVEAIPVLNDNSIDDEISTNNSATSKLLNGNEQCTSSSSYKKRSSSPINGDAPPPPPMTMIPHNPFGPTTSTSYDSFTSLDKKFNKYNAFGQFIAAALADLSDDKATDVMQRITMDIFAAQRN
ncbi:unnamed protein product [Diamesa serratosioi]